jgi:hypothetical protein
MDIIDYEEWRILPHGKLRSKHKILFYETNPSHEQVNLVSAIVDKAIQIGIYLGIFLGAVIGFAVSSSL